MVAAPGQTGGPLGGQLEEGKRETKTLELPAISMTKALISRMDGWMDERSWLVLFKYHTKKFETIFLNNKKSNTRYFNKL